MAEGGRKAAGCWLLAGGYCYRLPWCYRNLVLVDLSPADRQFPGNFAEGDGGKGRCMCMSLLRKRCVRGGMLLPGEACCSWNIDGLGGDGGFHLDKQASSEVRGTGNIISPFGQEGAAVRVLSTTTCSSLGE